MNELTFWEIIESNIAIEKRLHQKIITDIIRSEPKKKHEEEITNFLSDFQEELNKKIFTLFKPKIAQIFYLSTYQHDRNTIFISNDGFIDFRAWIVSLGEIHFDNFLNFNNEKEILKYDLNPNLAYRADIPFMTSTILRELNLDHKKSEIDYYFDGDYELLMKDLDWKRLETKYPKIWERYQRHKS